MPALVQVGDDVVDQWEDYIDLIADSVYLNSGRGCINCSGVWASRHTEEIAQALAEKIAPIEVKSPGDPEAALAAFGYTMTLKQNFMNRPRKERPTLWNWMQKPRNVWAHYILALHKGKEGHWILVKGVKMCDTFTEGRWTFVVDGPHRGARIMEIFEVRRSLAA